MPVASTGMAKRGISPNVMPEMLALRKPLTVVDIEREVVGVIVLRRVLTPGFKCADPVPKSKRLLFKPLCVNVYPDECWPNVKAGSKNYLCCIFSF